jgi:hypothetical protein
MKVSTPDHVRISVTADFATSANIARGLGNDTDKMLRLRSRVGTR